MSLSEYVTGPPSGGGVEGEMRLLRLMIRETAAERDAARAEVERLRSLALLALDMPRCDEECVACGEQPCPTCRMRADLTRGTP